MSTSKIVHWRSPNGDYACNHAGYLDRKMTRNKSKVTCLNCRRMLGLIKKNWRRDRAFASKQDHEKGHGRKTPGKTYKGK